MKKYNVYQVLQVLFDGGYISVRCLHGSEKFRYVVLLSVDGELLGVVSAIVARNLYNSNVLMLFDTRRSGKYDYSYYNVRWVLNDL
ncbi:hypothetical protein [Clostridium merdae]|uniref:hypothetical protein n=1 Tax=Clostridium merdae TaxID=1958780 RepID=UPI00117D0338|nr:hypothetical protein [Clostridium merdae]